MSEYYAYVVVFSGISSEEMTEKLEEYEDTIVNWYRPSLRNTVFVVSDLPAKLLTRFLRKRIKGLSSMLVLDAATDRNGWLPESAWEFLRHPKPVGK